MVTLLKVPVQSCELLCDVRAKQGSLLRGSLVLYQ